MKLAPHRLLRLKLVYARDMTCCGFWRRICRQPRIEWRLMLSSLSWSDIQTRWIRLPSPSAISAIIYSNQGEYEALSTLIWSLKSIGTSGKGGLSSWLAISFTFAPSCSCVSVEETAWPSRSCNQWLTQCGWWGFDHFGARSDCWFSLDLPWSISLTRGLSSLDWC